MSAIAVLDADLKHDAALAWWQANQFRLPPTRTFRTRSGGLHLYFAHAEGIGCSAGKLTTGIDVRADGGYVIHWFSAGFDCLDHTPPARWPGWLLVDLLPKPNPRPVRSFPRGDRGDRAIDAALHLGPVVN